ncbi:hypothetical protein G9P44_000810 [Scheffersomyces stipitis]|nr:hypothetical protein G9P44_000810 [Scheffersomyces stipitis]
MVVERRMNFKLKLLAHFPTTKSPAKQPMLNADIAMPSCNVEIVEKGNLGFDIRSPVVPTSQPSGNDDNAIMQQYRSIFQYLKSILSDDSICK